MQKHASRKLGGVQENHWELQHYLDVVFENARDVAYGRQPDLKQFYATYPPALQYRLLFYPQTSVSKYQLSGCGVDDCALVVVDYLDKLSHLATTRDPLKL